jgi:dCMP deaminase
MRPSKDETWLNVAKELSRQSTCLRRAVGCVLVDGRGHVLSTGWNGVVSGQKHCNEVDELNWKDDSRGQTAYLMKYPDASSPREWITVRAPFACPGAKARSGTGLDGCDAVHAEQNALTQCHEAFSIATCYVTASPCDPCCKQLLSTPCRRIVFLEEYPQPAAKERWLRAGREWVLYQK